MMGRGHVLSGAALWLGGTSAYSLSTNTELDPINLLIGGIIFTGASLGPDLDSYTATATKSFGFLGRIFYHLTNLISLFFYNLTRARRDDPKENGHRTFTHTILSAIAAGAGMYGLTSIPGTITLFGIDFATGQFLTLLVLAFFFHLSMAGLFSTQVKKASKKVGPYVLMAVSLLVTFGVSRIMPTDYDYQWLAFVVAGGLITHMLGDFITKAGVPLLWPLKISNKRWYDLALPGPLRLEAGGAVETSVLYPAFSLVAVAGLVVHLLILFGVLLA